MNELSGRLGVNANTVVKAYRDLSVVGILYSLRGKGVFVKDGANEASEAWCRSRIVARTF